MKKSSLVSIVTPSYNASLFIEETIQSVIDQTYTQWEMIIIDDKSPDNANDIIQKYALEDTRIKLIKLKQNSGPAVARNRAIKEAKGRYIAFLDSDDLWFPNKLEKQIYFMEQNSIVFSYGTYEKINAFGEVIDKVKNLPSELTYKELLKENKIGCLTVIYDTQKLNKVYMPLIFKRQDYGLWLKILKTVPKAYKVPGVLAQYRVLEDSISSNKLKLIKYNYKLFRNIENFPALKAIYYVSWNVLRKVMN